MVLLFTLIFLHFVVLQIAGSAYAWWRGGGPERLVALFMLAASGFTILATRLSDMTSESVRWGVFGVDVALLLALAAVALLADRFWSIWITSNQLIAVVLHFIKLVDPNLILPAYSILLKFLADPMILALAVGTWRHRQRVADYGSDASWSPSSIRWLRRLRRPSTP